VILKAISKKFILVWKFHQRLFPVLRKKNLEFVKEWQSRPLNELYPVVFIDAIHYRVRRDGKIVCKAAYTCLGIDKNGIKDVLGIYIGENESSAFWLSVLTDLQNRGVEDILIACVDGLKGFPEAIGSIYPKTEVQTCIVHQIRNSLKYVGSKYQKEFMTDLKLIYQAATEELALKNLDSLFKLLYLTVKDATVKWSMPKWNWG
jgi:transposase-like protein